MVYTGAMTTRMRIGTLARRAGFSPPAIRFYEAEGLISPAQRTPAGYRLYGEDAVNRLEFIRRAKLLDLSLAEIKALIDASSGGAEALRHVLAHKLVAVRQRREELETLERALESLYVRVSRPGCGCRHLEACTCQSDQPTPEEIDAMIRETTDIQQGTCTCGGSCAADQGCVCGCTCCGEQQPAEPGHAAAAQTAVAEPVAAASGCECGCC